MAEGTLWYQPAEAKNKTNIAHSSITLPPGIQIRKITQASKSSNKKSNPNSIWISKQGYMDKTAIELVATDNTSITLLISAFLPIIKVIEGSIDFQ